ncbi:MAG: hypothetical protein ACI4WV_05620 [Eubacteriales bacterium]
MKHTVGSQEQAVTSSDIEENTQKFMESLKADEEHVQSYFDHPKVKGYKGGLAQYFDAGVISNFAMSLIHHMWLFSLSCLRQQ